MGSVERAGGDRARLRRDAPGGARGRVVGGGRRGPAGRSPRRRRCWTASPKLVPEIRLEVLLEEGTRLVVLREPFGAAVTDGPARSGSATVTSPSSPGASAGRSRSRTPVLGPSGSLATSPSGRRTASLAFDREAARGVPAGPAGGRLARGGHRARSKRSRSSRSGARAMPDRHRRGDEHALRHGPTTGDRVRLGDTDLWIRIEEDLTEPGDQALWGYAKNWRSRMTQHDRSDNRERARRGDRLGDRRRPAPRRREVRPRDQGRPDRRDRAGGQPGHHRRRRPHDRAEHVADPVPRLDRDACGRSTRTSTCCRPGSCRSRSRPA